MLQFGTYNGTEQGQCITLKIILIHFKNNQNFNSKPPTVNWLMVNRLQ